MPKDKAEEIQADAALDRVLDLLEENSPAEALEECRKAVRRFPEWETAHNLIGMVYLEVNRLDEAVESFTKAVALDPRYYEARQNLRDARLMKEEETYVQLHKGNREYPCGYDIERQVYGETDLPGYYYYGLPSFLIRGYPGHRNLPGKSGYDPMDMYVEQGYMEGLLLKKLFTLTLPMDNIVYRLCALCLGAILAAPSALVLWMALTGAYGVPVFAVLPMIPMGLIGLFLIANVRQSMIRGE